MIGTLTCLYIFLMCRLPIFSADSVQTSKLADKNECGYQKSTERVFGGQLTEIGEFPWMVLLGYKNSESGETDYKCGGTLINHRYILTAAHCLKIKRLVGVSLDHVRLGEWRISTVEDCVEDLVNEECSDPVVDLKVEAQIPHLNYSRKTGNHDIALLRLERDIAYTDYIRPICLPISNTPDPAIDTQLVISGWGSTENGTQSDYKLKLEVPVVARNGCAEKFKDHAQVTENQLCAGGITGKDACQGDSGGPLMGFYGKSFVEKIQWYQEGVISRGLGCGRKDFPGIYTRTAKYLDWILENIS